MNYFVITPAKNEERYIGLTLESMIQQTLKPVEWIIVDDGSTDGTKAIVEKYQLRHPWIKILSIDNKEEKKSYGSKVIRAFNVGYDSIKNRKFDFIVKLDADLSFPTNYFEEISNSFAKNGKLGICGGYIIEKESDYKKKISSYNYVQGPVKSIRAECFNSIGGFVEANGWDGLDQLKALYLGWNVINLPIKVTHHRVQTTEYRSLKFFQDNGVAHYRLGNNLFLTLVRAIVSLNKKPYVLASLSYLAGYIRAAIEKEPKLVDEQLAKFIRSYHYKRMLSFKR